MTKHTLGLIVYWIGLLLIWRYAGFTIATAVFVVDIGNELMKTP